MSSIYQNPYQDFNDEDLVRLQNQLQQPSPYYGTSAPTLFQSEYYDNLIKWQLDIKEELERIEHLLRKHVPKIDEKGNMIYVEPENSDKLFNEKGINEILNLLAWYLNKNIILSNFSEEEIKLRCNQFADLLADFIHNNYQNFGLDNKEKIKHYPLVVMNIVNTVEAAYNRALNGGERESLRTARTVSQTEPLSNPYGNYGNNNAMQPQRKSLLKPWTWGN